METEIVSSLSGWKQQAWETLLSNAELKPDYSFDKTVLLWDNGNLTAAGSRKDNLLKCIVVDEHKKGTGLTATVLTALRQDAFQAGFSHLFLYTKPANQFLFSPLFFYPVAKTSHVLLMENRKNGIREFLNSHPAVSVSGAVGAIVMNCDPFTLGHRYLVEQASRECSHVYVFILSEDKGFFSSEARLEMARRGTADFSNVTILPTGPYLISSATFPTYFLKNRDAAQQIHCQLDIQIFLSHFVPHFHVTHRYVGTEPLSHLTNQYNDTLRRQLPAHGITLREIPRLDRSSAPVSASAVRACLQEGRLRAIQELVPASTYEYILEHHS